MQFFLIAIVIGVSSFLAGGFLGLASKDTGSFDQANIVSSIQDEDVDKMRIDSDSKPALEFRTESSDGAVANINPSSIDLAVAKEIENNMKALESELERLALNENQPEIKAVAPSIPARPMLVGLPSPSASSIGEKININKASQVELERITGVGPAVAQSIIDYRNENKLFYRIEDIRNVDGIKAGKFEAMKDEITVGDVQAPPQATLQAEPAGLYSVIFEKIGDGDGVIRAGLEDTCGVGCKSAVHPYNSGVQLVLSATSDPRSQFRGWAGKCSGNVSCRFTVDSNAFISADFGSLPPPPPVANYSQGVPQTIYSNVNHILISEVQITGGLGKTTNDFIEIYNPTSEQFNLKGYRLVKRTETGATDISIKSWTTDVFIPARGYYLWANSKYTDISAAPDAVTTASIADNNGAAIRFGANDTGTIIDALAWGTAQNIFAEGSAFSTNPGVNQSLERTAFNGTCASPGGAGSGNGCDTDNNLTDFVLNSTTNPKNSGL